MRILVAVDGSEPAHEKLAREMTAQLQSAGFTAEADPRAGDAATEILAVANASKADLIVIGTHGRTGLARLVLGTVARNVLQYAPCSVLIVRGGSAETSPEGGSPEAGSAGPGPDGPSFAATMGVT